MSTGLTTFQLLAVIGRGGSATVYRARMDDSTGFSREVALKLLHPSGVSDQLLARFRDEARIMARIRDRGIVVPQPPTRVSSRWALVMELVDGTTLETLLVDQGMRLPPAAALEMTGEVARILDKAWHQPDVTGQPLELVHRDLKPPNLQLTPIGDVKVLDFGIARANFQGRESRPTDELHGTVGYVAPERFKGDDGPWTDIYSLGIVLRRALGYEIPGEEDLKTIRREILEADSGTVAALQLAREMYARNPKDRPTAKEVWRRCNELAGLHAGANLSEWTREHVPTDAHLEDDEMVGRTLLQFQGQTPRTPPKSVVQVSLVGAEQTLHRTLLTDGQELTGAELRSWGANLPWPDWLDDEHALVHLEGGQTALQFTRAMPLTMMIEGKVLWTEDLVKRGPARGGLHELHLNPGDRGKLEISELFGVLFQVGTIQF